MTTTIMPPPPFAEQWNDALARRRLRRFAHTLPDPHNNHRRCYYYTSEGTDIKRLSDKQSHRAKEVAGSGFASRSEQSLPEICFSSFCFVLPFTFLYSVSIVPSSSSYF